MLRVDVADFSGFVGSGAAVARAKREFLGAAVTLVVGAPGSGRTAFLRCLRAHFSDRVRFEDVPDEDAAPDGLGAAMRAVATRKHGVMERYVGAAAPPALAVDDLRLVLDGLDAPDRAAVAALEAGAATRARAGLLVTTGAAGLRKLSGLRKRPGTLVLQLVPPGRDAVLRWARRTLLPRHPDDADLARLRAAARALNWAIPALARAYREPGGPAHDAGAGSPDAAGDLDNSATLARLFASPPDAAWLLRAVAADGGSMVGQLAWHNAPAVGMDDAAYVEALDASLAGMRIERSGHLAHDPALCALGHALSAAPYAAAVASVDRAAITYTCTTSQGGARAVARRALAAAAAAGHTSVAEAAAAAASAAAPRPRAARPAGAAAGLCCAALCV